MMANDGEILRIWQHLGETRTVKDLLINMNHVPWPRVGIYRTIATEKSGRETCGLD